MALKSVYSFSDYRLFLRDFYLERKQASSRYSYKTFATKAGLQSPNYLKLVIDGKRNLTVANIQQFAKALGLNQFELDYFESLVHLNQASSREEEAYYKRRLAGIKNGLPSRQLKFANERDLLSHFLFPVILMSLLGLNPGEAAVIASQKLGLPRDFVNNALRVFEKSKVLSIEDGRYCLNSDHLVYHDPAPNRSQKQFLRNQLEFSKLAFDCLYDGPSAKFCSHTFTVVTSRFQECMDEVVRFMAAITQRYDGPSELSATVQLNFQLFQVDKRVLTKC